jgi:hypothetical protein
MPLAELLEAAKIEVCLVNPRHVKNVPGRKTDVQDCQWLQYLHTVGLLRAAFRTPVEVRPLRVLWRHRDALVRQSGWQVQHIHKALDQMNVQIHHVLSDITGATGTAIVEAILAGQRDPAHLASLRDKRVKADEATLTRALTGDYRTEHLFCLQQAYAGYQFAREQIVAVEAEVHRLQAALAPVGEPTAPAVPAAKPQRRREGGKNLPGFPAADHSRPERRHATRPVGGTGFLARRLSHRQALCQLAVAVSRQPHQRRAQIVGLHPRLRQPRGRHPAHRRPRRRQCP